MSEIAQTHRFGLYLKNRDSAEYREKIGADFYEKNHGDRNWNFVKFTNKVESSSRTRTLFWNYQAEEGSLPQPHDSFPDAGEAINDFWSMSGNFIYRHHVEPRVKLYSPGEESFPFH